MNYFAHGRDALDDPYRLAGTAVPDWLNLVNRRCRMRTRRVAPLVADADPRVAAIAAGVLDHLRDDQWFHNTPAFVELSLTFCRQLSALLGDREGYRPYFLGHIIVEIMLDAVLIADDPARLERYYDTIAEVDGQLVELAVNRMAAVPADGLARVPPMFCRERFLSDYALDAKLLVRLNQVMRRVSLPSLPDHLRDWLPSVRQTVSDRRAELLSDANQESGSLQTLEIAPGEKLP